MPFFTQPCIIQPQAVTFGFAFTHNVIIGGAAAHVVNSHTYAAFTVVAVLLNIVAHFIHGVLAAEGVVLTDSVVADAHPHALFIFRADVACFAKAFI